MRAWTILRLRLAPRGYAQDERGTHLAQRAQARHGRRRERGAAAVEFGLVLPVLLLIVFGTIDWGHFFYVAEIVGNAAREGARAGSLHAYDPANPSADTASITDAHDTAVAYATAAGLKTANLTVTPTLDGTAIKVQVQYTTGSLTGFKPLTKLLPANANATAEMRR